MLSRRIRSTVSAPARLGLTRIMWSARMGSAFRKVPETR